MTTDSVMITVVTANAALLSIFNAALIGNWFLSRRSPLELVTRGQQMCLLISDAILLFLLCFTFIWDYSHPDWMPFAQFPLTMRLWVALPMLLLGDYATFNMVWATFRIQFLRKL